MKKQIIIALGLLALMFLSGFAVAVMVTQKDIETSGNIVNGVNISLYEDKDTQIQMTYFNWQNILPTETRVCHIFVQNDCNIPLNISVLTKNWLPIEIQDCINFTAQKSFNCWDDALIGTYPILNPHMRGGIRISITPYEDAILGDFSFTIVIVGTSL